MINLTQVAALELAPKRIRVNAIAPGLINTPMTERYATDGSGLANDGAQVRGDGSSRPLGQADRYRRGGNFPGLPTRRTT